MNGSLVLADSVPFVPGGSVPGPHYVVVGPVAVGSLPSGSHVATLALADGGRNTVFEIFAEPANHAPSAHPAGPYTVAEGATVVLDASGSTDPDGDTLTYAWDLDADGIYEAPGLSPTFSAAGLDGPSAVEVALEVCDPQGACDTAATTVEVTNVAPTVDAGGDVDVYRDEAFALVGTFEDPGGPLDQPYAWSWDVAGDTSGGEVAFGEAIARSASFPTEGTYLATLVVTDDDGGRGAASLVVTVLNRPPDCSGATPTLGALWPPDHRMVAVGIEGVSDAEGDDISVVITSIHQDEEVRARGSGTTGPDATGVGTGTAQLRAERSGREDGRVYHVAFAATDGHGGSCEGVVKVSVPHSANATPAVDGGAIYDSTQA